MHDKLKRLVLLCPLLAAGCNPVTPWIANGYSEPVAINATQSGSENDNNFIYLKPGQCLDGWGANPPAYTNITVRLPQETMNNYDARQIAQARQAVPNGGIFVLSESGLAFKDHFTCTAPDPFVNTQCAGGWPCSTGAQ